LGTTVWQGAAQVQLQSVTTYTALGQWFDHIADGLAVVESGGYVRLLYAARADNRLSSLTLAEGTRPPPTRAHRPSDRPQHRG